MHRWGDEGVDWEGINDAALFIGTWLRRWGRIGVTDMKEKYGTVRVYCHFGWHQFHCITHPGYHFSRYPKWLWELDCDHGPSFTRLVNWMVIPVQKLLYRWRYGQAVRRWPHLRREILAAADLPEVLGKLYTETSW